MGFKEAEITGALKALRLLINQQDWYSDMAQTYAGLHKQTEAGIIFTDDHAPVEQITNSMVVNYLLSGKVDSLR